MGLEPVLSGAAVDPDGDLVGEGKGGFHGGHDLIRKGTGLVPVEVEEELVVDLEKHAGLE